MDILQIARQFSVEAHKGERLKFVPGPYYTHPKAVSERQWTIQAKVVALLHDTVESHVKNVLGKHPNSADEEQAITEYLGYIGTYFINRGCDIAELIPEINILTKRTTDTDYKKYIGRIIEHAKRKHSQIAVPVKLADLHDNNLPERNPAVSIQTNKDKIRLTRYDTAIHDIRIAFPDLELRLRVEDRPKTRELPGHGRLSLAALKAKEDAGARGVARRALRPKLKKFTGEPDQYES